jgi:polyvinyl alcohol dehydrogenase (cytochrome)
VVLLLVTAPVLALTGVAIVAALQVARSAAAVEWTSYHLDNSRSANPPGGTYVRTVSRAWAQSDLDGPVYAEPLVYSERVFVITENDSLYALDASTGQVEWRLHLASAAINPGFGCGDIDPLGITSTPVIDSASGRLYTAGVVDTVSGSPRYQTRLFAVDVGSRSVIFNVRVDLPGADIKTHNQRGALTLTGGRVYIPFGGRAGDCGRYHGVITSVLASDAQGLVSFRSTDGELTGGGFWAPGGLA